MLTVLKNSPLFSANQFLNQPPCSFVLSVSISSIFIFLLQLYLFSFSFLGLVFT